MPERDGYGNERPNPRYVQKYDKPFLAEPFHPPQTEIPARRRRAEKNEYKKDDRGSRRPPNSAKNRPGQGGSFGSILIAALLASLLLGLIFSVYRYSQVNARLNDLRAQRQAEEEQHQNEVARYVNMRRRSGVEDYIQKYAQEFSVNASFISAIIARESSYAADAQSYAGARGLMQIMPDTGDWAAGRLAVVPYSHDRLFEPELNIRFGVWYLNYLSSQFNGDPVMIAAAFHAGPNNVKQWALKLGEDQKTIRMDQIPTEDTIDYVKKVMNAYALYYEYDSQN